VSEVTAQATFCATLVDEWTARGVRHAVVAPGSRNSPMALAIAERADVAVHVVHDERAAAFVALGLGLGGVPAVLLCTSGTAAANFHPAVVEAGLSAVPMLVVTADRPPELRDVGAPQTIDQTHLYGRSVRWFHDPGIADTALAGTWRSLARRAWEAARAGPVHLNLPFRDPLVGRPGPLPEPAVGGGPAVDERRAVLPDELVAALDQVRGVVLAGGRSGADPDDVAALVAATQWPVLADPTSGMRGLAGAVAAFDSLLRHPGFAADHSPDVVVRIGRPAASKVLGEWLARSRATVVQVGGPGEIDPDHRVAARLEPPALRALADKLGGATGTPWLARWRHAAERAESAIDAVLDGQATLTEPSVARTVARALPHGAELVVASSMPVRDLEWFGGPTARAHANRGANGIDGVVSTALGVVVGRGAPTVALVGDIAFVHDGGALTALRWRGADLRIVVVDNDGGGIFSFLPQATELPAERFEQLFGTPHGTDVVALAKAHGLHAVSVTTPAELSDRLAQLGPSVTRVPTHRAENVAVHAELNAAVVAALG
jgi:2-succinyl-5-enolpyruvyl-6-hydroxy-3-cyclohexene-1-carboxylate synthase